MDNNLLNSLLQALLPPIVGAFAVLVARWLMAQTERIKVEVGSERWQQITFIISAAVKAAEQSGLAGYIADEGKAKKEFALQKAGDWLAANGLHIDVNQLDALIETAVFNSLTGVGLAELPEREGLPPQISG